MKVRHFGNTDNAELRAKIDQAKSLLSMPKLMERLGLGKHAKTTARCPWHDDQHPSFSVFQKNGAWFYRRFVGCSSGDEIALLVKHLGISRREAIKDYLEMAGFPASRPSKSREYPKCPGSPMSLAYPVSPVSNGQGLEKELGELAARNACTCAEGSAERKRFKLARDLRKVEKGIGRKLTTAELRGTCDEWERISLPFLDWRGDDHFAMLIAEVTKVRVPTGEGDTVNKALEIVSQLSDSDLPEIPGYADARKAMRKLAALHLEMSRLCGSNVYFLSYRDAAKVCDGLTPSSAHTITLALASPQLGMIKIVSKGKAGPNSRKAAEFRYLLSESGKGEIAA